ncbi:MAG: carboxylesterase family protein [Bacteroidota bacterium]
MKNVLLAFFTLMLSNEMIAQSSNFYLSVQTKTDNGVIEGNYDTKTGIQTYFGVPFAKPPVGDLRWKEPQPLEPWKNVKETKKFGPRPVQGMVFGDMNSRSDGLSEDCLYLNVWTPAKRNTKNLPVLVYFYGGGNVAGDASEPRYDGESMAKKGIVVITCNYRLGIFGNFAHPELSAESAHKASGNYGYFDQLAALKWVNKNIAAFGGDPTHVTIAGESAGSIAVSYQMASPLSKGLIHAAIGESGAGINPTMAPTTLKEAEKTGKDFSDKAGVTSLKELRAVSTRDLFDMYQDSHRFGFPVVIDGYFLPNTVVEIFNKGKQAQIPLLLGWNSAEIPGQAFMQGKPYTVENFQAQVKKEYPNNTDEVLAAYQANSVEEVELAATALAADRFISYSTWKWFDLHRKNSKQDVYRYLYSKIRPPMVDQTLVPGLAGGTQSKTDAPVIAAPKAVGAPHACEIEYCMGNLHLVHEYAWTADDKKVSQTMSNYFANFIKSYNPNAGNLPEWKSAKGSDAHPPVMIIDTVSKTENANHDARYELHDKLFKNK